MNLLGVQVAKQVRYILPSMPSHRCDIACDQGKPGALSAPQSGKVQPENRHLSIHHWSASYTSHPRNLSNFFSQI